MRAFVILSLLAVAVAPGMAMDQVIHSRWVEAVSLDPHDPDWDKAAAVRIPLIAQDFVAPFGGGVTQAVEVRSLHTPSAVYFRLAWKDRTRSATLGLSGKFTDACAIQFPLKQGAMPSPFMGEQGNPVNIWMWRAVTQEPERYAKAYSDFYRSGAIDTKIEFPNRPVQSLLAEGFGTLSPNPVQDVEGAGIWKDGEWTAVLRRRWTSKKGAKFQTGRPIPIAFAVWDGGSGERNGNKSLSPWQTLILGEGEVTIPSTDVARGRRVFARYGCAACHGPGGTGGIKNPNAQGGMVPPIHRVKEGFTEEEVKRVIRLGRESAPEDPRGPLPPLHMNAWGQVLDEQELDDLVKYLWSLAPKTESW